MGSVGIIMSTFMSLKEMGVPPLMFPFFPVAAVVAAFLGFGMIYEGVCITRMSEGILESLMSNNGGYLRRLGKSGSSVIMKRAKAFTPVFFPIGGFCQFSMGVMQNVLDEIINQVLFLYSL